MSLEVQEEEDTEDDVKVFDMSLRSSSEEVINALFYPLSNLGKIVFLDERTVCISVNECTHCICR